jgi:hypothetical protein
LTSGGISPNRGAEKSSADESALKEEKHEASGGHVHDTKTGRELDTVRSVGTYAGRALQRQAATASRWTRLKKRVTEPYAMEAGAPDGHARTRPRSVGLPLPVEFVAISLASLGAGSILAMGSAAKRRAAPPLPRSHSSVGGAVMGSVAINRFRDTAAIASLASSRS